MAGCNICRRRHEAGCIGRAAAVQPGTHAHQAAARTAGRQHGPCATGNACGCSNCPLAPPLRTRTAPPTACTVHSIYVGKEGERARNIAVVRRCCAYGEWIISSQAGLLLVVILPQPVARTGTQLGVEHIALHDICSQRSLLASELRQLKAQNCKERQ